jgi:hypothetical protein
MLVAVDISIVAMSTTLTVGPPVKRNCGVSGGSDCGLAEVSAVRLRLPELGKPSGCRAVRNDACEQIPPAREELVGPVEHGAGDAREESRCRPREPRGSGELDEAGPIADNSFVR